MNKAIGVLMKEKLEGIRFSPKGLSKCYLLRDVFVSFVFFYDFCSVQSSALPGW